MKTFTYWVPYAAIEIKSLQNDHTLTHANIHMHLQNTWRNYNEAKENESSDYSDESLDTYYTYKANARII